MIIVSKQERYIIIPYNAVIDNNLHTIDKVIYGEIISLSNKKGYCYANNQYFMKENKISKNLIIQSLKRLEQNKYIEIIYNLSLKNSDRRTIYLKNKVVLKNVLR